MGLREEVRSLRLAGMGPTCFGVRLFVELSVIVLLLLLLLLHIFAALRMKGDPNLGVFLVCTELHS